MDVCKSLERKRVALRLLQSALQTLEYFDGQLAFFLHDICSEKFHLHVHLYCLTIEVLHQKRPQVTSDGLQDSPTKLLSAFFFENRRLLHEIKSHLGRFFLETLQLLNSFILFSYQVDQASSRFCQFFGQPGSNYSSSRSGSTGEIAVITLQFKPRVDV